jgi:lipopolysaccharide heptosyltransferase II
MNVRSAFPHAQIDFLTEPPSREVLEGNPSIDNTIIFDSKRQSGVGLIFDIRRNRYDMVIDLFGNPRSALITYWSGALYRIGYRFKWRQYCYNVVVEPRGGKVHNTEFNLDALRALNVPIGSKSIYMPVSKEANDFADRFFSEHRLSNRFVVALNSGGGWSSKRWRIHNYAALGDTLATRFNAQILILWGPGEQGNAEQLKRLMKSDATVIPQTNLKGLAALLGRCSALVTNDSGPMHIAAAVGTPVVAIYGPTNPELQGPVGNQHVIVQHQKLVCLGCNFTECPIGNPCMDELSPQEVLSSFEQLMEKNHLPLEEKYLI